jgi:hypothetical protein
LTSLFIELIEVKERLGDVLLVENRIRLSMISSRQEFFLIQSSTWGQLFKRP